MTGKYIYKCIYKDKAISKLSIHCTIVKPNKLRQLKSAGIGKQGDLTVEVTCTWMELHSRGLSCFVCDTLGFEMTP